MTTHISVIIPNWNGAPFLRRTLGAALHAARCADARAEIIVVDDASTDDSISIIERQFPQARLLKQRRNLGFGPTVDAGIRAATGDIVILLNNDLAPREAMIAELTQPLTGANADHIFGVSGKTVSWTGETANHLNMAARWQNGHFALTYEDSTDLKPTMFVQGGSCAFRRDLYLQFGGFPATFAPGYWEDYDLSYLALKAGYTNLYAPKAVGLHLGQGSFRRAFSDDALGILRARNAFYFHWANLTEAKLFEEHTSRFATWMAGNSSEDPISRQRARGLAAAMANASTLAALNKSRRAFEKRSDVSILDEFRNFGTLSHPSSAGPQ